MKIRVATTEDACALAALNRHVHDLHVAAEPAIYTTPDAAEVEEWLRGRVAAEGVRILVAQDDDGVLIGLTIVEVVQRGHLFARRRRVALVHQVAVHELHRRRGCGRALMDAVLALAREERCESVELEVRAFNVAALRFYEALGYRPFAHRLALTVG